MRFAFGAQMLVEAREDWIVMRGRKRGHVKATTQSTASTEDGAFTAQRTTVVIKRRQTRECSGLPPIELAEFGHLRQQEGCRTCTDSGHRGELLRFSTKSLVLRNETADALFDRSDLLLDFIDQTAA